MVCNVSVDKLKLMFERTSGFERRDRTVSMLPDCVAWRPAVWIAARILRFE
jgi:hypothetical protein